MGVRGTRLLSALVIVFVATAPSESAKKKKPPKSAPTFAGLVRDGTTILTLTDPEFHPGFFNWDKHAVERAWLVFYIHNLVDRRLDEIRVNFILYQDSKQQGRIVVDTTPAYASNLPPNSTFRATVSFGDEGSMAQVESIEIGVGHDRREYHFKPGEAKKIIFVAFRGTQLVD